MCRVWDGRGRKRPLAEGVSKKHVYSRQRHRRCRSRLNLVGDQPRILDRMTQPRSGNEWSGGSFAHGVLHVTRIAISSNPTLRIKCVPCAKLWAAEGGYIRVTRSDAFCKVMAGVLRPGMGQSSRRWALASQLVFSLMASSDLLSLSVLIGNFELRLKCESSQWNVIPSQLCRV
jgi:hypothetical protein